MWRICSCTCFSLWTFTVTRFKKNNYEVWKIHFIDKRPKRPLTVFYFFSLQNKQLIVFFSPPFNVKLICKWSDLRVRRGGLGLTFATSVCMLITVKWRENTSQKAQVETKIQGLKQQGTKRSFLFSRNIYQSIIKSQWLHANEKCNQMENLSKWTRGPERRMTALHWLLFTYISLNWNSTKKNWGKK